MGELSWSIRFFSPCNNTCLLRELGVGECACVCVRGGQDRVYCQSEYIYLATTETGVYITRGSFLEGAVFYALDICVRGTTPVV